MGVMHTRLYRSGIPSTSRVTASGIESVMYTLAHRRGAPRSGARNAHVWTRIRMPHRGYLRVVVEKWVLGVSELPPTCPGGSGHGRPAHLRRCRGASALHPGRSWSPISQRGAEIQRSRDAKAAPEMRDLPTGDRRSQVCPASGRQSDVPRDGLLVNGECGSLPGLSRETNGGHGCPAARKR